ncbi:MerR family transcriptional regulator [Geminicoccus flavidas]|uniref:DNA-binding protein n=1 Tax=Geminicoccus flavidas TaxID=2506407 RepID=UPI00190F2F95|nr:DNA-binding protein [Geminicoccus flavidas]
MDLERRFLSVKEFCATRGIGKTKAYAEIGAGRLAIAKIGRATRIPIEAARAWDEYVLTGAAASKRDKVA